MAFDERKTGQNTQPFSRDYVKASIYMSIACITCRHSKKKFPPSSSPLHVDKSKQNQNQYEYIYVFHRCVKRNIATKVKDKHVETKHHIETHLKVSWTKTKLRTHTLNHAKMSENRRLQPRSHAHRTWATNKKTQNARIAVLPNKASKEKKN